jgi:hypothetical protein
LVSLIAILVFGFKYVGRARTASEGDKKQELFIWGLGASLFANLIAFFGISYFDQTSIVWYAILAIVISATAYARNEQPVPQAINVITEANPISRTRLLPGPVQQFGSVVPKDNHTIGVRTLSAKK